MLELSAADARRLALGAQGFADPAPRGRVTARHIHRVLARTNLLQMDSVNVLARAHYLPVFSRIGPYPASLLDEMAYRRRELFEYWAHEASLIPMGYYPLFRWRMDPAGAHHRWVAWAKKKAPVVEAVEREVTDRGPIAASELLERGKRSSPWWGWNDEKTALEWLFKIGRVTAASRRNFERVYDLTERVIPQAVLEAPAPPRNEARKQLMLMAARSLGVATARDIADYFRLFRDPKQRTEPLLLELLEEGSLQQVKVDGWKQAAYLFPGSKAPRTVESCALLAPFDPLVWERARTERLFGFHYRIEIYTPAPKRIYGYYVLPFLMGEQLAGRVDLKADRKASALLVQGAFHEPDHKPGEVADALAGELRRMAAWLGLEHVRASGRGTLARALRGSLKAR